LTRCEQFRQHWTCCSTAWPLLSGQTGHGQTYRSAIKPLAAPRRNKTLNTETGEVFETTLAPASEDEAAATGSGDGGRRLEALRSTSSRTAGVLGAGPSGHSTTPISAAN